MKVKQLESLVLVLENQLKITESEKVAMATELKSKFACEQQQLLELNQTLERELKTVLAEMCKQQSGNLPNMMLLAPLEKESRMLRQQLDTVCFSLSVLCISFGC